MFQTRDEQIAPKETKKDSSSIVLSCDHYPTSRAVSVYAAKKVIADGGHQWVPVSGSWHNPGIVSERIFAAALEILLQRETVRHA